MATYLVIGLYVDDEPVVAGVVEHVEGTCDALDNADYQRWATIVDAIDPATAEAVALAEIDKEV